MAQAVLFPGQGAQFRGMGRGLFSRYPTHTRAASDILGYSIEELCVEDPDNKLTNTQYTQPALYVVNALTYLDKCASKAIPAADYLAGHSLGEYNALLAADVFSFEEGLQLVKLRGQLMGEATGGGMAAVVGVRPEEVQKVLREAHLPNVELANFNTPTQVVLSATKDEIAEAGRVFTQAGIRCVILNVGAAFHSRHMQSAQEVFSEHLKKVHLREPKIPVIANLTALPYERGQVAETLGKQIASPVLWMDSVIYMLAQGDLQFTEVGSSILTKMYREISEKCGAEVERKKQALSTSVQPKQKAPASKSYFQPWW